MKLSPLSSALVLALFHAATAIGQPLSEPQNRNVLLEQFTAMNCGNCPSGHVVSGNLEAAYPDDVVVVGIHGGPLAVPGAGQPDLRSPQGGSLFSLVGIGYTPQATINRRTVGAQLGLTAGQWVNAANTVLQLPSPVNLAISNSFEPVSRTLSIDVDLLYTANGSGNNDRLHVLLTEDHITAFQSNYGAGGSVPAYDHRHVLRTYVTPLEGVEIPVTMAGDEHIATFQFVLPTGWDEDQVRVVAFINEPSGTNGLGEVYQVEHRAALDVASGITSVTDSDAFLLYPVPARDLLILQAGDRAMQGAYALHDATGRVVRSLPPVGASGRSVIDVRDLVPGVYLMRSVHGSVKRFTVER